MEDKIDITRITFDDHDSFKVHILDDKYSFFHINITDEKFYINLFNYFFCEDRLFKYAENKNNMKFEPSRVNYVTLFKLLEGFIDSENIEKNADEFEEDIKEILREEYQHKYSEIGNLTIRLDKIGKIGEFLFSSLLWDYFEFDCIIPKVHLSTDPNMSVYGIDTLFYSEESNLILFGESKFSKSLANGIELVKKSLKDYEKQITDEFRIVLSSRIYKNSLNKFNEKYGEYTEMCIDINEFIEMAGIEKIGIPIFIAHGKENDISTIMKK